MKPWMWLVLPVAAVLALTLLVAPPHGVAKVEDFGAYWSAALLLRQGEDPYDGARLYALQQTIDPQRPEVLLAWGPPWSLLFVLPFTALDFVQARWCWLWLQVGLLLGCATMLWRICGGEEQQRLLAWLICFTFYPILQLLGLGQLTIWSLLAVVGFLYAERQRHDFRAGLWLGLAAAKPQMLLLFWLALLLACVWQRRWRMLLGLACMLGVLTGILLLIQPAIFAYYFAPAFAATGPLSLIPPTLGSILRKLFAPEARWLALVPTCLAVLWLGSYFWQHRQTWNWQRETPLLVCVAVLTMWHGWVYDLSLLLVPLLPLALWGLAGPMWRRWLLLGLYAALNISALVQHAWGTDQFWFVWICPAVCGAYVGAHRAQGR